MSASPNRSLLCRGIYNLELIAKLRGDVLVTPILSRDISHCFSPNLDIISDIGGVIARELMDFDSSYRQTLPAQLRVK